LSWVCEQKPIPSQKKKDMSRFEAGPFQFGNAAPMPFEDVVEERPLQVFGAGSSTGDQVEDRKRKVKGQLAGTSIVINNPGG